MNRLVLIAHGTRAPGAEPLLPLVADDVARLLPGVEVRHGYVEFSSPSAPEALAGSADPVVVPFFLGGGYHVEHDLPSLVTEHGSGTVTRHLGPEPDLLSGVVERLTEQLVTEGADWQEVDAVVLAAAGTRRTSGVAEAREAARAVEAMTGVPTRAAFLSAADPSVRAAVRELHDEGAEVVALATYLLAEGHFSRALHGAGAEIVAPPIGHHHSLADVVVRRYLEQVEGAEQRV